MHAHDVSLVSLCLISRPSPPTVFVHLQYICMVLHNASIKTGGRNTYTETRLLFLGSLCFVPLAVVWNVCNEYAFRCGSQCDRVLATNMNCILVVCGMHM